MVQRVRHARVDVAGECIAEMGPGLLVLVGVGLDDQDEHAMELVRKITGLRIFEDEQGRMNDSLLDTGGTLGLVSQFTLLADTRKGRRPSFGPAARPEEAEPLFNRVVEEAKALGVPVVTGRFGAAMEVTLLNDGPVTLLIDTAKTF